MYMHAIHSPSDCTAPDAISSTDHGLSQILEVVADHFEISVDEMMVSCRSHTVWIPRMAAMYLARMLTPISLIALGQIFGGRSHSTVLRAYRRCRTLVDQDPVWSSRINTMLAQLVERSGLSSAA